MLLQVQEEMVNEVWSDDTLKLGPCLPFHGPANQVLFLGPRVKMGIYEGRPNRICPHTTTGRADYFGPFVNRQSPLAPVNAHCFRVYFFISGIMWQIAFWPS